MTTTNELTDHRVPPELAERLKAVFDLERAPASLHDLAAVFQTGSQSLPDVEALYSGRPTRHEVRIGGTTRHTHCIMDALLVPIVAGVPAEVRSASPLGDGAVTLRVGPDAVEADPPAAVVSFGVAREDRGAVQQTACPYINAFPSEDDYRRWAAQTPEAVTMALPLADAFVLARAMAVPATDADASGEAPSAGCC